VASKENYALVDLLANFFLRLQKSYPQTSQILLENALPRSDDSVKLRLLHG